MVKKSSNQTLLKEKVTTMPVALESTVQEDTDPVVLLQSATT